MTELLLLIFILSVYGVVHSYLLYPVFMMLTTSLKRRVTSEYQAGDELPEVAVLMAAYNEEKVIAEKIKSVINSNYPHTKLKFYIGSDASTDKTDEIVRSFSAEHPWIVLVPFAGRTGKSGIINALAEKATSEIFILTDANVIFTESTVFNLVRHFKNASTAQVCANITKVSENNRGIASQEKSYIALENKIKFLESIRWNVVMGAEGACYAIRKKNFAPVPPKFYMDDFYITMNVIEQKMGIVFDPAALCYEDVPTQADEEYKRKIRISIGNFQNLFRYKALLFHFHKGYSFAFWSHKVLRWLSPFFIIAMFVSSGFLSVELPLFRWLFILQFIGFCLPVFDKMLSFTFKPLKYLSHFYYMNLALLHGFFIFVKGVKSNVWQPTKRNV